MPKRYADVIARELNIRAKQAAAAIELLDSGNTVPFIARYRKEATGTLDEEQLRALKDGLEHLRALDARRETVLASVEDQGALTPELRESIEAADSMTALEDLYQPYRPKRRTRASMARERGLDDLAQSILEQPRDRTRPEDRAASFLNDEVPTADDALAGARDIVAETVSDNAKVRGEVREKAKQYGEVATEKVKDADDPRGTYETYYNFTYRAGRVRPYQVLAINRAESEGVVRVHVEVEERDWRVPVGREFRIDRRSPMAAQLEAAIDDAASRLLLPAIERDVRRALTEEAEERAIQVFAENVRSLLSQPPLSDHVVMGVDPAYRTGCKIAVVDSTGKVLATGTIYPHPPQSRRDEALDVLARMVERAGVTLIAIGNGTASRETEALIAELTRERDDVHYLMVSEAGASVYSASPLARAELPDLDVSIRGAVSIARRVLDPLAELVKIDPKAIGVGMYQHDVNQNRLDDALNAVVESVVNRVGVDVNTASAALLTYIAGIGPTLAERIVAYRDENGPFRSRREILKVKGIGPKSFEQAAGFLRVREGANPLDASAIHPESYAVAEALLDRAGLSIQTPPEEREPALKALRERVPAAKLAKELGTGVPTLEDIFEQLIRPGRDPREDLPAPILRSDVLSMDDLREGMLLGGTVRNVVDFGAFVDIGVKNDGLLHRSQIPRGVDLGVGDVIEVKILKVEKDRGRIGLGWPEEDLS